MLCATVPLDPLKLQFCICKCGFVKIRGSAANSRPLQIRNGSANSQRSRDFARLIANSRDSEIRSAACEFAIRCEFAADPRIRRSAAKSRIRCELPSAREIAAGAANTRPREFAGRIREFARGPANSQRIREFARAQIYKCLSIIDYTVSLGVPPDRFHLSSFDDDTM